MSVAQVGAPQEPGEKNTLLCDVLVAFRCLDVHDLGHIQYDEMYRLYKLLFKTALTNDQILDLTFRALEQPELSNPEDVTFEDFTQVMSLR